MRATALLLATGLAALSLGQGGAPKGVFETVRPQIVVFIREHDLGPELLQVSAIDSKYPADLLRRQIEELGKRLKVEPRGLTVYTDNLGTNDPKLSFLKATFAVDGLIENGAVTGLQPLIQAFAGAPEPHTVTGLAVVFEGLTPNKQTLRTFQSRAVEFEGRYQANPPTLEYRVRLLSQNPGEITVGPQAPSGEPSQRGANVGRTPSPLLVWTLVGIAGLAAGALVYSVLIRRASVGQGRP